MRAGSWEWGDDYIECRYPGSVEAARRQVPGLVKLLGLDKRARILDCPCGWGRYSNPLAELGYDVVGFDFTEKFIEMARLEAPPKDPPRYEVRDMRKLDISEEYDALLNLFGSFGYYSRRTDLSILKAFTRALKPGGRLMIDQYNKEKMGRLPKRIRQKLPGGKVLVREQSMDLARGTYHLIETIHSGTHRKKNRLEMNWYSVTEYRRMLRELGIEKVELYGDYDGTPYSVDSERQIVLATKSA